MHVNRTRFVAAAALFAAAAAQAKPEPAPSVYEPASHYTALLQQQRGIWQLLPADGQDLTIRVDPDCASGAAVPHGIWLVARRGAGIVLQAPSATALPAGHPGEVAVVDCDARDAADDGTSLRVPARLAALLAEHSGAVLVGD